MATTITMHAPSPTPAHLAAALSSLPTRPRSQLQNIELPPIRQAVPEIDLAPAPVPVDARPSSPYAQKRRLLTPEPERGGSSGGGSSGMQTPYRTSPRSTMTGAPGGPPGPPPMTVFASAADQMPYPGRGYPEPAAPRLFDPRADYAPQAYSRDRYDAQPYPPPSQYAVYDGGGGAGKRGREFGVSVNGNGYPPQNYVAETGYGGEGMGDGKSGGGGRKRRGNLPKETTDKLRAWFVGHLHHPYPTEDEKQDLMVRTGLQMNQISNWFINARRRQLPSMISNARAETAATANGSGGATSNGAGASNAARDESDGSSYGGEYGTEGGSPGRGGRL
ncbi:hypothetical protein VE01_02952 [Pseudogymnoascus verrucosus]|uniref:Homeobox domain-containing protein n=1 Tax=Pseudogymnoascus verrucosus TaxID=342668 RepID=A0A1B8GUM3_9PEZI|nr:uncharacterized protein VE01_02952 [Pseudogymnoascus verrucosus]OBT99529.2 hypothetical protein VE01_02952 [Pseudogymnoascus verrucosus]